MIDLIRNERQLTEEEYDTLIDDIFEKTETLNFENFSEWIDILKTKMIDKFHELNISYNENMIEYRACRTTMKIYFEMIDERTAAAIRIQKNFRGMKSRRIFRDHKLYKYGGAGYQEAGIEFQALSQQ